MSRPTWFVYLIRTRNNTLYTGITTNVERRFAEHCAGKGAKYLKGRGPLSLVFQAAVTNRSAALKAEHAIKKLSRAEKLRLLNDANWLYENIMD